ncbi:MAG: prenyltransferase [Chloroflexi bacterium]|nr:prenyltransferase [Chloroflexota bacterium]
MQRLITILRLSRPIYLLLAALTYVLGSGIARFLGKPQIPAVFWLGLIGACLAQLSMSLLAEVFRPANESIVQGESIAERKSIRDAALNVSIGALAADAVIAFLLYRDNHLPPPALFFLGLSLLTVIVYAVPPLRLFDKGFGEFLVSIHLAYLIPSVAFLLQFGNYHQIMTVVAVPLTLLAVAVFLTLDFVTFSDDIKYERSTLLSRLGWERAVPLHHGLVILSYVLFGAGPLLGYSLALLWPVFLTLPFGLLQIYFLRNIALGARPLWTLLTANAFALFGLTAYFLTLAFWLR